ncbi:MAG TPA: hypothetical protein VN523_05405 [Hyphomicrobiaceae bacterium]|jgi:hypothetical protein|nr:hypothetical protein [Hyphomicrobiaceae bacterium]
MSQSRPLLTIDKQIADAQRRIGEQKLRLQRMIAQGTIAQSDDDLLREMYVTLRELQGARVRG